MKRSVVLLMVMFTFGVVRASAQDVRYDYDQDKDFSKYKTYTWVPIKGANPPDESTAKITSAVDSELAKKGLTKTDSDNADLLIGQTAVGTEWYGDGGTSTTYGSWFTVYVGQLDLSMYDPAAKQLVWRGVASKTLDPKAKPEKKEKDINKAVQKLLKKYPPQQKK